MSVIEEECSTPFRSRRQGRDQEMTEWTCRDIALELLSPCDPGKQFIASQQVLPQLSHFLQALLVVLPALSCLRPVHFVSGPARSGQSHWWSINIQLRT